MVTVQTQFIFQNCIEPEVRFLRLGHIIIMVLSFIIVSWDV